MNPTDELREELADHCHEQWGGWMEYLFSKCTFNLDGSATIPADFVARWQRQTKTSYAELPENEKESDQKEADRFIAIYIGYSHFPELLEVAEQALTGIDFENRKVLGFAPLTVLKNAVEYYLGKNPQGEQGPNVDK